MARKPAKKPTGAAKKIRSRDVSRSAPEKAWAVLIYLCGDHHALEPCTDQNFIDLCRTGSQPDVHVVVQYDRRDGARRFLLPPQGVEAASMEELFSKLEAAGAHRSTRDDDRAFRARINTGEPAEAVRFFKWGMAEAPARKVALIFSGLGINPDYVQQQAADPAAVDNRSALQNAKLFSFCHDETSRDDLEAAELLEILVQVKSARKDNEPVELVGLDLGAGAFVEIAYQMEGLAQFLVASQTMLPDAGWPYAKLLEETQKQAAAAGKKAAGDEVPRMARGWVDAVVGAYPKFQDALQLSVIDLRALSAVGPALDTVSLALMQSLGDWNICEAVAKAMRVSFISARTPGSLAPTGGSALLPAVDMIDLLEALATELRHQEERASEAHGVRARVGQLADMVSRTLEVLSGRPSAAAAGTEEKSEKSLIHYAAPRPARGLSIMLPPPPESEDEAGFVLGSSNYVALRFAQSVHWVALVTAYQLIRFEPHVLWRIVSSMLSDVGGGREALLDRLVSPSSIVSGMQSQFQVLNTGNTLSVSLEAAEPPREDDSCLYRLRLESASSRATIREHTSRLYQPTMDAALRGLEQLLTSREYNPDIAGDLEALGRTLGEDLIQDLAEALQIEWEAARARSTDAVPHLRLRFPGNMMPYPWELMHDRQGMLCERFAMGRQVFMPGMRNRRILHREPGPIQVLVIGDPLFSKAFRTICEARVPPWKLQQLEAARLEARVVAETFLKLADQLNGLPVIEVKSIIGEHFGVSDLRKCLRSGRYDIIHYAGHALFEKNDPEGSGWLLSDGLLRAREIRNTLAWGESPPWLVFANACEAGMDRGTPTSAYQGDVYGLATAFINQGVAAYIGPLWPVNDQVATQFATDFYSALLLDHATLGEALRDAKLRARDELIPLLRPGEEYFAAPRVLLSWAGMALYGDPTARLLQTLWTPHSSSAPALALPVAPVPGQEERPRRERAWKVDYRPLRQASLELTRSLITGPMLEEAGAEEMRGAAVSDPQPRIELVEHNGVRTWRIFNPAVGPEAVPISPLTALAQTEQVRGILGIDRGLKDYVRVIGRWVVQKVTLQKQVSLIEQLVAQYDVEQVTVEGLLHVQAGPSLTLLPREGKWPGIKPSATGKHSGRLLLLIHGTFSKTQSPVEGLGEEFLARARDEYDAVIGLDHWTLSRTPEENARDLWDWLPATYRTGHKIDIISHSRGGLVARAFVELLNHAGAVSRVIFVGTPNAGTSLANPQNWGTVADTLVNLVHTDPTGMFGKISGFLVQLLARGTIQEIPGLQAQNPLALTKTDFLGRLQLCPDAPGVTYAAVASNYEPAAGDFNLKGLWQRLKDTAKDGALDRFYGTENDLVVDTAHVWARHGKADLESLGAPFEPDRLLLFNPQARGPKLVRLEKERGVHHTNLFTWPATRKFLLEQLELD